MKRQKETKRLDKAKDKEARREERKKEKAEQGERPEGVDPDIAHIIPGPQPINE
jgi:hypothetical protein